MPLFASLVGAIATGFVNLFSTVLGFRLALKLAAYATWITVLGVFLGSVYICVSSLWGAVTSFFSQYGTGLNLSSVWSAIVTGFGMGLGMLIPSNAGAVLACMSSVWIATNIYKVQRQGIHTFGA